MSYMFYSCQRLSSVNLSGTDLDSVTSMKYMFSSCNNLSTICVPLNVNIEDEGNQADLPGGTWIDAGNNPYTHLPDNVTESFIITREITPVEEE